MIGLPLNGVLQVFASECGDKDVGKGHWLPFLALLVGVGRSYADLRCNECF